MEEISYAQTYEDGTSEDVAMISEERDEPNLLIEGAPRTGKTYLAMKMLEEYVPTGRILFIASAVSDNFTPKKYPDVTLIVSDDEEELIDKVYHFLKNIYAELEKYDKDPEKQKFLHKHIFVFDEADVLFDRVSGYSKETRQKANWILRQWRRFGHKNINAWLITQYPQFIPVTVHGSSTKVSFYQVDKIWGFFEENKIAGENVVGELRKLKKNDRKFVVWES